MRKLGVVIRRLVLVLVIILQVAAVAEANLVTGGLQQDINNLVGKVGPGIVVGIDRGGQKWFSAAGRAEVETGRLMTVQDQLRLASVTKTFTAVLTMKLAEEGRLSLTDTVEDWLPGAFANGDQITVRMLLNHSSGISNDAYMEPFLAEAWKNQGTKSWSSADILPAIQKANPAPRPGVATSYSNAGYYLLGLIAEKASGESVNEAMTKRFFQPNGMSRTAMLPDGTLTTPCSPGYAALTVDGTLQKQVNVGSMNLSWDYTAGSGVSTAVDMVVWVRALVSGKLVSNESFRQMVTPNGPSPIFGYGLMVDIRDGVPVGYVHTGQSAGVNSRWYYDIATDTVIFINTNYLNWDDPTAEVILIKELSAKILSHLR